MKKWSKYEIPFIGLRAGKHNFSYNLDKTFFEGFERDLSADGEMEAHLEFDKKDDYFVMNFTVSGALKYPCDRCAEEFILNVHENFQVLLKFREDEMADDQVELDVVFISRNDTHYNVAQLLYELSILSIPLQRVHPDENGESTCNEELLKKWSDQQDSTDSESEIDPRWAALKKIKKA